jgi:MFS family permease
MAEGHEAAGMEGRHWSRAEALRHWSFRAVLPGVLAPPFIGTTILFQQSHLSAVKGWSPAVFAASLPLYAAITIAVSFLAGWLCDRYGVRRLLGWYQAPMALGALTLGVGQAPWSMTLALALCGVTQGAASAIMGTLWPALYGTRWIGGVRAASMSALVLATGLGPGFSGALIDLGAGVQAQFVGMGLWAAATCVFLFAVAARLRPAMATPDAASTVV